MLKASDTEHGDLCGRIASNVVAVTASRVAMETRPVLQLNEDTYLEMLWAALPAFRELQRDIHEHPSVALEILIRTSVNVEFAPLRQIFVRDAVRLTLYSQPEESGPEVTLDVVIGGDAFVMHSTFSVMSVNATTDAMIATMRAAAFVMAGAPALNTCVLFVDRQIVHATVVRCDADGRATVRYRRAPGAGANLARSSGGVKQDS